MNRQLAVMTALGAVAASGCSVVRLDSPPDLVEEMFDEPGGPCRAIGSRAQRVANAEDVDGMTFELWLAPTEEGGDAVAVLFRERDFDPSGNGPHCSPDADPASLMDLGGGDMTGPGRVDRDRQWTIGHAPDGAEQVRADFGGDEVVVDVGVDGYFIVVHSEPNGGDNTMISKPLTLTALDADGNEFASD